MPTKKQNLVDAKIIRVHFFNWIEPPPLASKVSKKSLKLPLAICSIFWFRATPFCLWYASVITLISTSALVTMTLVNPSFVFSSAPGFIAASKTWNETIEACLKQKIVSVVNEMGWLRIFHRCIGSPWRSKYEEPIGIALCVLSLMEQQHPE